MKKGFKLIIITLFIIFVTIPKNVFAIQIINFSDTHTKRIITLDNGKTLIMYVPKNNSYKNVLVHFHGWYEYTVDAAGVTAMEDAIRGTDYTDTVVFYPVDGICSNVESGINETVNLVYKEYQDFIGSRAHTLSVSQFSGTRDTANAFISLLGSKRINLFLFDSYDPHLAYTEESLKKVNNLIILNEYTDNHYLGSAEALGERFRNINKTGKLKYFQDSSHQHGYADDKGLKMYAEFIKKGDIAEDFLNNITVHETTGTNTNAGSGTTSGSSSGQTSTPSEEEEDKQILGGGKDTGTTTVEGNNPRLEYDNICESEGFKTASKIAGTVILIAKWLGPLILIIMGMIDFFKAVISSSDKALSDATGTFIKRMIIAIVIPIIPGLLYYLVDFLVGEEINGQKIEFGECTKCLEHPLDENICKVTLYDYDDQRGEKEGK